MKKNLLLVEENYSLRQFYGLALSRAGFNIIEARYAWDNNGETQQYAYHVALCDVNDMNETNKILLSTLLDLRVPTIVLSVNRLIKEDCVNLGVDLFLVKPVPVSILITYVKQHST